MALKKVGNSDFRVCTPTTYEALEELLKGFKEWGNIVVFVFCKDHLGVAVELYY